MVARNAIPLVQPRNGIRNYDDPFTVHCRPLMGLAKPALEYEKLFLPVTML